MKPTRNGLLPVISSEPAIDVRGAAALLCMSTSWVYKRIQDGTLPHLKIGRAVRFDPIKLREWIARQASGDRRGLTGEPWSNVLG